MQLLPAVSAGVECHATSSIESAGVQWPFVVDQIRSWSRIGDEGVASHK